MIYIYFILFIFIWYILTINFIPNKSTCIKTFVIGVFIIAWLIIGNRDISVGIDNIMYYHIFEQVSLCSFVDMFDDELPNVPNIELGWRLLCYLISSLGGNYYIFTLFISAIFCLLCSRFVLKSYKYVSAFNYLLIVIVLIQSVYLSAFNITRQMIAVMISANAWLNLKDNQRISAICLFICAFLLHKTAIVSIAIIAIWYFRKVKNIEWITMCFILVIGIGFSQVLNYMILKDFYGNYIEFNIGSTSYVNLSAMVWLIITILSLYIITHKQIFTYYQTVIALYCFIFICFNLLSLQLNYAERIALYFSPYIALLFPIIGQKFKSISLRLFYNYSIVICYSIWFLLCTKADQYKYILNIHHDL